MLRKLLYLGKKIKSNIDARVADFGAPFIAFGLFGILNYPIYYIIWSYEAKQAYESFLLRLIATILCALLLLKNYWPRKLKNWLPLYWYFTLTFCMPFFFTFMLLKNNSSAVWLMSSSTIFFWLVLLVDWVSYLAILFLGIFLAWIYYYLTTQSPLLNENYMSYLFEYIGALIVATFFAYNKENAEKLKLQGVRAVGVSIAHELRTPLTSIGAGVEGAKRYLPVLIDTYAVAKQHGLPIQVIQPRHYEILATLLDDLEKESQYSNVIINMLLMNAKQNLISSTNFKLSSISICIKEALRRYPFQEREMEFIKWENESDFVFYGDALIMEHVLFNLLKNALYYIEAEMKGSITIWYETTDNYNVLYFKDTAKGIPAYLMPKLFERFYTTTPNGAGLGLAFCKMAMTSFGGNITCKSKYGKFTQFNLIFPKVK
jgi:signal transduction histidine kinase